MIAVRDGQGYAEYSDSRRHCQTLGDPDSGEWHTTYQGHFLPGSGISVDQLAAMVIEFSTQPNCLSACSGVTSPDTADKRTAP